MAIGLDNTATAQTLAHWRFEAGPLDTNVQHTADPGYPNFSADVVDSSGNGNDLSVWETGGGAGFVYREDLPGNTLNGGAANNFSIQNTGGGPAAFTAAGDMRTIEPAAFTIEASFKPENGGFRSILGRDSRGLNAGDPNLASLYFQLVPGDAVAIKYIDKDGFFHVAESAPGAITGFAFPDVQNGNWYNMAGVSDGSTLSLYLDDVTAGTGYQLVAQTDLTLSGSTNTALSNGSTGDGNVGLGPDGNDWAAGDWTVGRGLYNGGHADRGYGLIDEVRISTAPLDVSEFLFFEEADLTLVVNTIDGSVDLRNNTAAPFALDYYQISSPSDALLTGDSDWNSLSDQNLNPVDGPDAGSTVGDGPGETWEESGGVGTGLLAELFLQGETSIAAGGTLSIGTPYNFGIAGSGNPGDLQFSFSQKGGELLVASVEYVDGTTAVLLGDADTDGAVAGSDLLAVTNNFGNTGPADGLLLGDADDDGAVAGSDLLAVTNNFGNTLGSLDSGANVPEPATAIVLSLGATLAAVAIRRQG